jgi:hypothetical protein
MITLGGLPRRVVAFVPDCLNDLALASQPAVGASQRRRELGQPDGKRCDQQDNRRPLAADL